MDSDSSQSPRQTGGPRSTTETALQEARQRRWLFRRMQRLRRYHELVVDPVAEYLEGSSTYHDYHSSDGYYPSYYGDGVSTAAAPPPPPLHMFSSCLHRGAFGSTSSSSSGGAYAAEYEEYHSGDDQVVVDSSRDHGLSSALLARRKKVCREVQWMRRIAKGTMLSVAFFAAIAQWSFLASGVKCFEDLGGFSHHDATTLSSTALSVCFLTSVFAAALADMRYGNLVLLQIGLTGTMVTASLLALFQFPNLELTAKAPEVMHGVNTALLLLCSLFLGCCQSSVPSLIGDQCCVVQEDEEDAWFVMAYLRKTQRSQVGMPDARTSNNRVSLSSADFQRIPQWKKSKNQEQERAHQTLIASELSLLYNWYYGMIQLGAIASRILFPLVHDDLNWFVALAVFVALPAAIALLLLVLNSGVIAFHVPARRVRSLPATYQSTAHVFFERQRQRDLENPSAGARSASTQGGSSSAWGQQPGAADGGTAGTAGGELDASAIGVESPSHLTQQQQQLENSPMLPPGAAHALVTAMSPWRAAVILVQYHVQRMDDEELRSKHGDSAVDEALQAGSVLTLFFPLPIFWALYFQMFELWYSQATALDRDLGSNFTIAAEQVNSVNPILDVVFLILIVGFEKLWCVSLCLWRPSSLTVVSPTTRSSKSHGPNLRHELSVCSPPKIKMFFGLFCGAIAFGYATWLEYYAASVEKAPSVALQLPQYAFLCFGEILLYPSALKLAYALSPSSMKSFVQSTLWFFIGVGNALNTMVLAADAASTDEKDDYRLQNLFLGYAGGMGLITLLFGLFLVIRHGDARRMMNDADDEYDEAGVSRPLRRKRRNKKATGGGGDAISNGDEEESGGDSGSASASSARRESGGLEVVEEGHPPHHMDGRGSSRHSSSANLHQHTSTAAAVGGTTSILDSGHLSVVSSGKLLPHQQQQQQQQLRPRPVSPRGEHSHSGGGLHGPQHQVVYHSTRRSPRPSGMTTPRDLQ